MPKEERQNVAFLYRTSPRNIDQYGVYRTTPEVSNPPNFQRGRSQGDRTSDLCDGTPASDRAFPGFFGHVPQSALEKWDILRQFGILGTSGGGLLGTGALTRMGKYGEFWGIVNLVKREGVKPWRLVPGVSCWMVAWPLVSSFGWPKPGRRGV